MIPIDTTVKSNLFQLLDQNSHHHLPYRFTPSSTVKIMLNKTVREYHTERALAKRRMHLEYKLSPEQIVLATKKAEKQVEEFTMEHR